MNYRVIAMLAAALSAVVNASAQSNSVSSDEDNREQVLNQLLPVLKKHKQTGRISFSGACSGDRFPFPIFPKINAKQTHEQDALAAVRDIFGKNERVSVEKDRSGMIRITIGKPPIKLLQTNFRSIRFDTDQQYNGWRAVDAVLKAKEVQDAMRKFGLREGVKMDIGPIAVPEPGRRLAHLPASIVNMTMDQALDLIAKTFGGVVIYETCEQSGGKWLVMLDFVER